MPTRGSCPRCHGQRTIWCLACHGTGKKPVVNTRCGECAAREMKEAPTYSQRPGLRFQSLIIVPVDSFVRNSRTASVVALVAASSIRRRLNTLAVQ
jgi:hypothetical protein